MQYSLDSTDGSDGNWSNADDQTTVVQFVSGDVYVRQANTPLNYRLVATIAPASQAPDTPTVTKKADGSVNVYQINVADTLEWSINGTDWTTGTGSVQDVTIPDAGATVSLRTKATASAFASNTATKVYNARATAPAVPTVTKKADGSANVYEINATTTQEWSINGTTWTTGTGALQDVTIPLTGATVSLRTKATNDALSSVASTKVYAAQAGAPSTLTHQQGTTDATTKLVGMTNGQEYRVGDGSWILISADGTVDNIAATAGQVIQVRTAATANTLASATYSYTLKATDITPQ